MTTSELHLRKKGGDEAVTTAVSVNNCSASGKKKIIKIALSQIHCLGGQIGRKQFRLLIAYQAEIKGASQIALKGQGPLRKEMFTIEKK